MRVYDLKQGEVGKITKIELSGSALERLSALGVRVGEQVEVISFSLLKSSVLISCAAIRVGLRKTHEQKIQVSV